MITQDFLKKLLKYDKNTGEFLWLVDRYRTKLIDKKAGYLRNNGYVIICISGYKYYAHRLAFLYIEGELPPSGVDHINRVCSDNRWCNLRHATQKENLENKSNNTDFVGVSREHNKHRWRAYTPRTNGKVSRIGSFKTHFAACYARHAYDVNNQ